MKIFNNSNLAKNYQKSAIAIGNFDGIHKGHQKVFSAAKKFLKRKKIKLGVLTFEPLPVLFFNKKIKNFKISDNKQKFSLLKKNSIDFIIKQKFKDMQVYDSEYEETVQAISFAGRQVIQQWYEIKNKGNISSPFINQSDQKLYLKHYEIFDNIIIPPITKPKKPGRLSRLFRSSKKK